MDYVSKMISHVKQHLGEKYDISYLQVTYDATKFYEKTTNYRYKETDLIPCLFSTPSFRTIYTKKNILSYDGTFQLSFLIDSTIANEIYADVNKFAVDFNGFFINDDGVRYKYKTSMPIEGVGQNSSGAYYFTFTMPIACYITNQIMGDDFSYYLTKNNGNETIINDLERNAVAGVDLYANSKEQPYFDTHSIGQALKYNFVLPYNLDDDLTADLIALGNGANYSREYQLTERIGDKYIVYKGNLMNVNKSISKGSMSTLTFEFDVTEVVSSG